MAMAAENLISINYHGIDCSILPRKILGVSDRSDPNSFNKLATVYGEKNRVVSIKANLKFSMDFLMVQIIEIDRDIIDQEDLDFFVAHLIAVCACISDSMKIEMKTNKSKKMILRSLVRYRHLLVFSQTNSVIIEVSGFSGLINRQIICEYGLAKAANLFTSHLALGIYFSQRLLRKNDGPMICLGTGSIPRGFADSNSDVDLFIIHKKDSYPKHIEYGEHIFRGISLDIKTALDNDDLDKWNMVRRWHLLEGVSLFSTNPKLIGEYSSKLGLTRASQINHIQCLVMHMGWIGFQPTNWQNRTIHGYNWPTKPDVWISRGYDELSNRVVSRAFDLMVNLLFLVNDRPYPGAKWKYFLVTKLQWLPEKFIENTKLLFPTGGAVLPPDTQVAVLLELVDSVFERLDEKKLLLNNIYQHALNCFEEKVGYLDAYR